MRQSKIRRVADAPAASRLKLGTFIGVFTPTVLTIMGVIMYLRLGWVVGNAGLWGSVTIVVLSNAITFVTALSMSQLATNMRVGVGGAYFLISRSFGLEVGGAIGIPLYLSQVLSVTLYAYGLAEIPTLFFDIPDRVIQAMACGIIVLVTLIAARSTELTLKAQVPVLVLIALSLSALFAGVNWSAGPQVPAFGPYPEAGFWEVFAVFFPAVTGVLTGLSLSGDLERPSESIPRGVLGAVAVGSLVYLALPFALSRAASGQVLLTQSLVWTDVAVLGWVLVLPGMAGAVLSSAFGSILSAPRTLQALATDRLAPRALAELDQTTGEPLAGLRVSGAIALLAAVFLPDLNAVASGVTVFFLTTYGALNAVSFLESLIGDPSFRPRIRIPALVSLIGALACFATMFLINPVACVVALVVELGIFFLLSRRSLESTWGDARSGLLLTGARFALLKLREARFDPRNWRPHILVLTTDTHRVIPALKVAESFGQHRGIVTLVHMIRGDVEHSVSPASVLHDDLAVLAKHSIFDAFTEVNIVPDELSGATTIAQANGMAGLHSNTVMLGLSDGDGVERVAFFLTLARRMARLQLSTLIYRPAAVPSTRPRQERTVVVWWAGRENNGDLMMLLAHLLTISNDWNRARIRLMSVVSGPEEGARRSRELAAMANEVRIDASVHVVERPEDADTLRVIREHSQQADFVFLGLGLADAGSEAAYARRILDLIEGMPATLLVRNESEFRGRLV